MSAAQSMRTPAQQRRPLLAAAGKNHSPGKGRHLLREGALRHGYHKPQPPAPMGTARREAKERKLPAKVKNTPRTTVCPMLTSRHTRLGSTRGHFYSLLTALRVSTSPFECRIGARGAAADAHRLKSRPPRTSGLSRSREAASHWGAHGARTRRERTRVPNRSLKTNHGHCNKAKRYQMTTQESAANSARVRIVIP